MILPERRPRLHDLATALFWGALCAAVLYFGWASTHVAIIQHYHPETARSFFGYVRFNGFVLLAQTTIVGVTVTTWDRPSRWPVRFSGAFVLAAIAISHFVSLSLETGAGQLTG